MFSVEVRYEMVFDVKDDKVSKGVTIAVFAVLIFTCLLGISIAIYALWRIFWKNADELKNVDKLTIDTAVSCIILHAMTVIFDPIGYWFFATNDEQTANYIWLIWDLFWTLSKLNLYFVYIYRCYITFKNTKYAYSPIKVYVPLGIAWILQLANMIIFMLHELDEINALKDIDNPLSDNNAVIIASSIYLILDFIIVLSVVFLFINPMIKLMIDLRTKSEQIMNVNPLESIESEKLIENLNGDDKKNEIELVVNDSNNNGSLSDLSASPPHSPTKIGAAYYNSNKKRKQKGPILTPTVRLQNRYSDTSTVLESTIINETTSVDKKLFNMKHFGRLQCPEDEEKENLKPIKEGSNLSKSSKTFKFNLFTEKHKNNIIWNEKQTQILNTGTRLALLCIISLSSGFVYQVLWILSVDLGRMGNFSYTWGIDTVINIICIYLSFQFAVNEYNILCSKCCHCHQCCFKCIQHIATKRVH